MVAATRVGSAKRSATGGLPVNCRWTPYGVLDTKIFPIDVAPVIGLEYIPPG